MVITQLIDWFYLRTEKNKDLYIKNIEILLIQVIKKRLTKWEKKSLKTEIYFIKYS